MLKYEKMILISINEQKIILIQDNVKVAEYPISTSKFGIGNDQDSYMTPLGNHVIKQKVGEHVPKNSVYKDGKFSTDIAQVDTKKALSHDLITTRILKLDGLENGINKGKGIDSFERNIWIHGTPAEWQIGTPSSHGCIRMKNDDIIHLYNSIEVGTPVKIELDLVEKVQNKHDAFSDRRHTFRLKDRRKKGVLDSSLWKMNNKERRKRSERRKK
ncbi:MAG: L,D-transpeptidase [Candidatus Cloacimonetes bacterium]|nr:L,D-transpeptidase [Candidatus Cloacimonadota bacterium]